MLFRIPFFLHFVLGLAITVARSLHTGQTLTLIWLLLYIHSILVWCEYSYIVVMHCSMFMVPYTDRNIKCV